MIGGEDVNRDLNEKFKQPKPAQSPQLTQGKLGLDPEEQAMNGNYGMAQTKETDGSEDAE